MGFDPAYRTGCKIAVVDDIGNPLDTTVVYPTAPQNKTEEAKKELTKLIDKYHVDNIRCNSKTYDKIMQTLKYNVVKTKNKYSKMYKEQKLHSMVAFDSLMFGPSIREDIKDDYIKIILPGDKNYKNVKKEDIVI